MYVSPAPKDHLAFILSVAPHSCCVTKYYIFWFTFLLPLCFTLSFTCSWIFLKLIVKIYVHLGMNILCTEYPWQSHFMLFAWPTPSLLVRHLVTACSSQVCKEIAVFFFLSFSVGLRWALWDFTHISNILAALSMSTTAWKKSVPFFKYKWTKKKKNQNWRCAKIKEWHPKI